MAATRFIAYYRVSTEKQGRSGLGLDAQREAVERHVQSVNGELIPPDYTETESGKRSDRPALLKALASCRVRGATLIVAKLDRLSRNVAFLSALMESRVEFVCADNPHATRFTIHILAAVAEHERDMISKRTKEALRAAKARGKMLGGRRPGPGHIRHQQHLGSLSASKASLARLQDFAGELRRLSGDGLSLTVIARTLNAERISTVRGGRWTATAVKRALARL